MEILYFDITDIFMENREGNQQWWIHTIITFSRDNHKMSRKSLLSDVPFAFTVTWFICIYFFKWRGFCPGKKFK